MNQRLLAEKLIEKLGFQRNGKTSTLSHVGKATIKKRSYSKKSFHLTPPDNLPFRRSPLVFNEVDKVVHPEQSQKVEQETGLDFRNQVQFAKCHIDPDLARLFFVCNKMRHLSVDNGTINLVDGYVEVATRLLGNPPASPATFWNSKRSRYKSSLASLRNEISANRRYGNPQNRAAIEDFLGQLQKGWGI